MENIAHASLNIHKIKKIVDLAVKSKNIFCIGVDGPTASGKTIFAKILKETLQKKCKKKIQIVQLDSLLVDRSIREDSLKNIIKANIYFEHEAELHMDFTKLTGFLNELKMQKKGFGQKAQINLDNMYSRDNGGLCTAKLSFDLCQDGIFIFEGHYTTRPDFHDILDYNIILLADRGELIARKASRVSGYRDANSVETYFTNIDEPSYISNYFRFADNSSTIIDNSLLDSPKLVSLNKINELLNTNTFFSKNKISKKKYREFIFGQHGLSNYCPDNKNNFESIFENITELPCYITKKVVTNILSENGMENSVCYIDQHSKNVFEVSIRIVLESISVIWIIRKRRSETTHLIFWTGGAYKIKNGRVHRLLGQQLETQNIDINKNTFWSNISDSSTLIDNFSLNDFQSFKPIYYCFLKSSDRVLLLSTAFSYTQFRCSSLGDFFVVALRQAGALDIEKYTAKPENISFSENFIRSKKCIHPEHKTSSFLLTEDFLILRKTLDKKILRELKSIYFKSNDVAIRKAILEGLLSAKNRIFVHDDIAKRLSYLVGFFPMSMTRIYALKRMGIEDSNILATNIYDITQNSIDASVYLETAMEYCLPLILQSSLNAVGQFEFDADGNESIGYLNPKEGVVDFTNSVTSSILNIMKTHSENLDAPLIGIGLDHVDVRGDVPLGRSKRFVDYALNTETVTHLTLDGSAFFKPIDNSQNEIRKSYIKVFKKSLEFLNDEILHDVDLEFCTGELNYIGKETVPHYPSGKEIAALPLLFKLAADYDEVNDYSFWLKNVLKLYVCNLGTTHHGSDEAASLKLNLASEWQKNLRGTSFVSPVLHGTTGSDPATFQITSRNCQKINIAGSLLKVMLESLTSDQKKQLGFKKFDAKSKTLCVNIGQLNKDQVDNTRKALRNEYIRLCGISNVKQVSHDCKPFIRKPLFGRNKIATQLFDDIEKRLSDGKNISTINDRG